MQFQRRHVAKACPVPKLMQAFAKGEGISLLVARSGTKFAVNCSSNTGGSMPETLASVTSLVRRYTP